MLEWHPTAENILVSAGHDHIVIVWDVSTGTQVRQLQFKQIDIDSFLLKL